MRIKNQFFIIFVISLLLFIENSEAGWKFWQKNKETITTTTTTTAAATTAIPISISLQSTAISTRITTTRRPITMKSSTVNNGVANPGLAIGMSATGENTQNNVRPNRPNPGTEVGQDISIPKANKPEFNGGNSQNYRNWAVDLTGAGKPSRNQPSGISIQEPSINDAKPVSEATGQFTIPTSIINLPDFKSTSPGNMPIQSPQPSVAVSSPRSVQPHATFKPTMFSTEINHSSPTTPFSQYSSGKTWADIAAGGSRSVSIDLPKQLVSDNKHRITERPTQPNPFNNPSRPASLRGTMGAAAIADTTIGGTSTKTAASDFTKTIYSSNPTYSKGNTVTDEDLEKLSEALYIKETNNANRFITVNLQKQTTSSSPTDQASQPLLIVSAEAFQIPTIQRTLSIFDNYQLDTHTNEYISPAQRQEESLLIDTFLSTNVMSAAMRFLADKGFIRKDYYEYKDRLRMIWFNLFSRGKGKIGSTGFEHVFMAETKQVDSNIEVLGLHNWIYFNAEEVKGHADYLGYIKKIDLGNKGSIIKMHAKFEGYDKPVTTMFIGTSPELEMALYTVCFYARPDGNCPVSLGNIKFNIITHKFRYRGKDLIGTAYPEI